MLHAALIALFADLERAGVRWSLLRMPALPEVPTGDVDLLVDARDYPALRCALEANGFAILPGWDTPAATLAMTYDRASACCLLLELTDEVSFQRGQLRTPLAAGMLARARYDGEARTLAPDDAFWALLLHCLLDIGSVPERYRSRLPQMASAANVAGPVAEVLYPHLPDGWSLSALREAARRAQWDQLGGLSAPMAAAWRRSLPRRERCRPRLARGMRALRTPTLLGRRYGLSAALLGPDGVGKSTLAAGINDAWPLPSRTIYMGLWKSGAGRAAEVPGVAQLLRGPIAASRYLRGVTGQLRGQLVIFDRYVHDARKPPQPPYVRLKQAYFWLLARSVPAPDLVLLLDAPGSVARARKEENSPVAADREREDFLRIARRLPHLHTLDATLGADQVRAAAMEIIWQRTLRRWTGDDGRRPASSAGQIDAS